MPYSKFNRHGVNCNLIDMSGVQKIKCTSCGEMFMSEKETEIPDKCPSCSKEILDHMQHESTSSIGGK
jgi:predicted Zn-ribbon and HTH transcriptional regulator